MNIYSIYKATNKVNNKSYIGFDSNFPNRKNSHKREYPNKDFKFYRAIRKYGWENFTWEIIYQSLEKDFTLNIMEAFFITEYNSYYNGYNTTLGGEGTFGYIRPEEDRKKISKRLSKSNVGRHWYNNEIKNKFCYVPPDETWIKGRINQKPTTKGNEWYNNGKEQMLTKNPPEGWVKGMISRPPISQETRDKLSNSNKGRKPWNAGKPAPQFYKRIMTPDGEFESVTSAANHYNKKIGVISTWIKTKPTEFYIIK